MKTKLIIFLVCIGIVAACQPSSSELNSEVPGLNQIFPEDTPLSSATLIPAPTKVPTQVATETPLSSTTFTPVPTKAPTQTPTEAVGEITPNFDLIADLDIPMILIPAGPFTMGEDSFNNGPIHTVILSDYHIDQFEVNNTQFALFLNEYGNQIEAGKPWLDITSLNARGHLHEVNGVWRPDDGYSDHPVVEVTWYGANAFCEWRGGRLPTEAEWEKAARGIDERRFPWGEELSCEAANYKTCNLGETLPIDSHPLGVGPYGIYNMAGNASEWTADWHSQYSEEQVVNPTVTQVTGRSVRVVRGGSWFSSERFLATYYRNSEFSPGASFSNLGFRCALPVSQDQAGEIDMNSASVDVPSGNAPTIDGAISPGEWDQAAVETFTDGSQLFLIRTEEYLFLGIQADEPKMIAGNVFIQRGDEILVLHTSAALGTAIYQKDEDSWQQIQDFSWRLRSTSNSESAKAERQEFLKAEGWLAANGRMGTPNELEYQIRMPEQKIRLTVVFTRSTYPYEKVPWPADLDDDCIKPTPGGFPAIMEFNPGGWGLLLLQNAE